VGSKPTSESDVVVVGKFVNSLNLSSNVELLNLGVEIYDSGVLFVTTKDELSFFRPG
jgi:hypothetical protein